MQENNEEKELQFNQEADSLEQIIKDFFGLSLLANPAFTINAQVFTNKVKKSECDCSTCRKRKENIQLLERCYQMEFKENA